MAMYMTHADQLETCQKNWLSDISATNILAAGFEPNYFQ